MSRDLNKVMVIGRLGGDPEMRYTPTGSAVTTFSVAAGRQWKDRDGAAHEETEWFRCVAWDKLAEVCNQYLSKGTKVYVEGRLKTRKYTDRDGQERYATEVVLSDMIILSPKGERAPIDDVDAPIFGDDDAPAPAAPAAPPAAAPRSLAKPRGGTAPNAPRNQPQPLPDDGEIPF
jgi:single-strand DNA-binding protein